MDFDLILAGGGLANGLIALRLAEVRPDLRVAIVEAAETIGGNHTWSSFGSDIDKGAHGWTAPLTEHRWDTYGIRFPKRSRSLAAGYGSATSERLDAAVRAALPQGCVLTGVAVAALSPTSVTLANGTILQAAAVIDGRGQGPTDALDLRWQKFIGIEFELAADHGLAGPIIMDATVPQLDGYRFMYALPFAPDIVFLEDTYYSDSSVLDRPAISAPDAGASGATQIPGGAGIAPAPLQARLAHPAIGWTKPETPPWPSHFCSPG